MENSIKAGTLLISEPFLDGGFFDRSVVLICSHNNEGSFGLTLNKEGDFQLQELVESVYANNIPVWMGGPVETNTLHFLHSKPELIQESIHVSGNIYWGGDFEQAISSINTGLLNNTNILFFMGYSGWGSKQLEDEIKRGSWFISHTEDFNKIDPSDKELWKKSMVDLGGSFKDMANYPVDPRLN